MDNIIILLLIVAIIGLAVWYVVKAKKRGISCIGCPNAKKCAAQRDTTVCGKSKSSK